MKFSLKQKIVVEEVMESYDYTRLFQAKTVAVIGASTNPDKLGGVVMNNLLKGNFEGEIYPVNPKGGLMFDRKVYTIESLPSNIDLATSPDHSPCSSATFVIASTE